MLSYVIRRVVATVPVMAVVALFVFSLLYIAPGDPAAVIAGDQATPADVERIRASLGLDRPFLIRFGDWVWHILHGDLGTSIFSNLPVADAVADGNHAPVCRLRRRPDRRYRRLESGKPDRPRHHGLCGARLLGAGLRGWVSCRITSGPHARKASDKPAFCTFTP